MGGTFGAPAGRRITALRRYERVIDDRYRLRTRSGIARGRFWRSRTATTSRWRSSYAAGVDYDDIVATLEREGIEKFRASYAQLLEEISQKRQQSRVPS